LNQKSYSPISVTGFDGHKKLIAKFFPEYKKEIALYRMGLKKGEQKDFEKYAYQMLSERNRQEIVSFMRTTDPIYWGTRNLEDILIDDNNKWFGIIEKERLIAITGVWNYQKIGYIIVVGTHPDYWNRGVASSLISSVLKEMFGDKEEALITVRVENEPAVHTYKKLGFSISNKHYSYERE
jgi:ribosomal protein S18 acetylase RimI-like enzyme